MQHNDLIITVSDRTGYTRREIRDIMRTIVLAVREEMGSGRDVHVYGLGKFSNLRAAPRTGRHPVTGDQIPIPAGRRVKFEPADPLKLVVRKSLRHFRQPDLEVKYGLKEKDDGDGQARSGDRPRPRSGNDAGRKGRRFPRI